MLGHLRRPILGPPAGFLASASHGRDGQHGNAFLGTESIASGGEFARERAWGGSECGSEQNDGHPFAQQLATSCKGFITYVLLLQHAQPLSLNSQPPLCTQTATSHSHTRTTAHTSSEPVLLGNCLLQLAVVPCSSAARAQIVRHQGIDHCPPAATVQDRSSAIRGHTTTWPSPACGCARVLPRHIRL